MPEQWIVWNRHRGTVQRAVVNDLRPWSGGATGQLGGLKHDEIGRVSVKELINSGYVEAFDYCIMSPDYWQNNERRLRQQWAARLFAEGQQSRLSFEQILGFAEDEEFTSEDVSDAYRIAAKNSHPDNDGNNDMMVAVNAARSELLKRVDARVPVDDDIPF
jgi:hypothetical protein